MRRLVSIVLLLWLAACSGTAKTTAGTTTTIGSSSSTTGQLASSTTSAVTTSTTSGIILPSATTSTTEAPSTTTTIPAGVVKDGTYQVGKDMEPGLYLTVQASTGCYWERLKGFSGNLTDTIANGNASAGQTLVQVLASDAGFTSTGCTLWLKVTPAGLKHVDTFGDGIYAVTQITPGRYTTTGESGCYWARLRDFTGGISSVLANDNVADGAKTIVSIAVTDVGFETNGCGTWTKA